MQTSIFRKQTPEDVELARRRLHLSALRATLAKREQDLAHLRAQLNSFEGRYIRQVGVLYIQLDDWHQRIEELHSPLLLESPNSHLETECQTFTAAPEVPVIQDLKSLFREVAKRIHPDLAADAPDERHRTYLMAQANAAFHRGDAAILHRMLHGYDPQTDSGDTRDLAWQLQQVLVQITQAEQDIAIIDLELAELAESEMAQLQQRTIAASAKGRDLLAEMAARVKGSIGIAMRRFELDSARARRKQAALEPSGFLSAELAPEERGGRA